MSSGFFRSIRKVKDSMFIAMSKDRLLLIHEFQILVIQQIRNYTGPLNDGL